MMRLITLAALLATTCAFPAAGQPGFARFRDRLPQDEIIYFLLPDRFENGDPANDRGGSNGDRLITGFDPAAKGFYHGGDLRGLIRRLDYLKRLGITAIWVGPIFKNRPVQGPPGRESAGYHGYWITDFTQVDPHLGTNADFKALVDAAHGRGMKLYMDIIANHTADVIQYRDCGSKGCGYRTIADYPYQRRGGVDGPSINSGFAGIGVQTAENFAKLTDQRYAYTPYLPRGDERAKTPAWLNKVGLYHNRGNFGTDSESAALGDFSGLDDLATENPLVVRGMIEIYGDWIDRFGVDGFRIDTAKHVNPEFWQAFVPAMLARAKAKGIPNFHIFGEIFSEQVDPGYLAAYTRVDKLPSVLDFAFSRAIINTVGNRTGTDELVRVFAGDALYEGGAAAATQLPTFLSNHDAGRFAMFVRKGFPSASAEELLQRVRLGHAMLLLLRGVPTLYAGDEQGFISDGGDQDAREDMFASKVASYNDNKLLGTSATTAQPNFDENHPLFREIATLARLRTSHSALTRGRTVVRAAGDKPGLFAVSRFDPVSGHEILLAFNTSTAPITANVIVEAVSTHFTTLLGACPLTASAPGSARLTIGALDFVACAAGTSK